MISIKENRYRRRKNQNKSDFFIWKLLLIYHRPSILSALTTLKGKETIMETG